jgi:ribonuclease E
VQPYQLPVSDLIGVAETFRPAVGQLGRREDAAVQAAIAAEPQPVRVPRERRRRCRSTRALVLVETRRDLGECACR